MATLESKINVPPGVWFRELSGEAVILNQDTGKYFGLDEVGARMWALLAEHGRVDFAYQALLAEYHVDAGQLQADLLSLADQLSTHGLLTVADV
jgi:hypothetical protein